MKPPVRIHQRLRFWFLAVFVCALFFAAICKESLSEAISVLFAVGSFVGITLLLLYSGNHLGQALIQAKSGDFRQLGRRPRWLILDGTIFIWMLIVISVANRILPGLQRPAVVLLVSSIPLGITVGAWVYLSTRRNKAEQPCD